MSRYIDADKLMIELNDWWYSQTNFESQNIPFDDDISVTIREAMEAVKEQPTADVRENVKGEWIRWYEEIKHDGYTEYIPHCKCPKCGIEYDSHTVKFINFCPNCGADMRG